MSRGPRCLLGEGESVVFYEGSRLGESRRCLRELQKGSASGSPRQGHCREGIDRERGKLDYRDL